jgi:hypothetical protein
LALLLFSWNKEGEIGGFQTITGILINEDCKNEGLFSSRTALFESLLDYFPVGMKEPASNLVDLVSMI